MALPTTLPSFSQTSPSRLPTISDERRLQANRRNGLLGRGPITTEGKAVSSQNSLKHGLLSSKHLLLPGENTESLSQLEIQLRSQLNPVGALEESFVARIVGLLWRLRRAEVIETGLFVAGLKTAQKESELSWDPLAFESLSESNDPSTDHNENLAKAFLHDVQGAANALSTISRYEVSLERSLLRVLHELQRMQAMRLGVQVSVPVAVDLNLAISKD